MSDEQVLTKEIADEFLEDPDSVELYYFTAIDDAAAESLGEFREEELILDELTSLSDAAAESLSKIEGRVISIFPLNRWPVRG